jgi:type IV secretory pathway VirB4 component
VIQSQLTDDKMTQSLELAKKQVESAIKKILQEEKVDLEHVTEDQFQLLIACLNDCEPIEAKDQKQNDDAQKSKDERFQQLMEQKWLTHEQWVKLSELYVENEWYEMSAEKVLPKLRGTMDKFLHAVHQNDTDAWKSILKETVDVDITDEFDPQSDIDEEDDDDDE